MAISEMKIQMVIDNYFKSECDTNTSIRQAFEKGFRIGAEKGASMNRPQEWISCEERLPENESAVLVTDANGHIRHAFYDAECDWFGTYEESMTIRAIAWMPLPEPYKGEVEK